MIEDGNAGSYKMIDARSRKIGSLQPKKWMDEVEIDEEGSQLGYTMYIMML